MNAMRNRLSFSLRSTAKTGPKTRLRALAGLVLFVLCVVLGYLLFFPVEALRQRLEAEVSGRTKADFTVGRLTLGLPLSLQLVDVRLEGGPAQALPLRLDDIAVRPAWLSLVTGDPGIVARGHLYGGELDVELSRSGRVEGELLDLELDQLPPLSGLPVPIQPDGRLSARLEAPTSPLEAKTVTRVEVHLTQAALAGLEPLGIRGGRIALGDVSGQGELQGRKLSLSSLKVAGGDLDIDAEGDLLMGTSPARSRLNLQVVLRPGEGLDPMITDLLSLTGAKPGSDGRYRFRLGGSLARPVMR